MRAHREELRRFGVVSLILFGSVARDQAGPQSDVDLLGELKRPTGYFTLVRLQEHLEHLLNARVDLLPLVPSTRRFGSESPTSPSIPPNRWHDRVRDMLAAARMIAQYTEGLAFSDFAADPKTIDAVVRNLSIIGEAARHIPDSVQALSPSIPWTAIRGMRHRIVHEYAQVDVAIV